MPRNCDEDSGHSSCTEQAPTVSPHMDNYLKSNHIFKTKEYRDNETNKNLVVSTKPRNNISLVKSPDMGEPFPSCRISNEQRRPIFNFFENPRMINPSNAHSTLNVPCNTDFQNSKIKINSGLVSALNKENLSKTKHPSNVFKRCKPVQRAASRLYKAESLKGKDACVGPEFIVRASQPARNIDLTVSGICEKRVITVVLLNGQKIEVLCDPNTITAGQLFEALIQSEKYEHNFMLGIAVLIGGDFIFLPDDYKIKKIAAEPWSKNLNKRKNNDDAVSLTVFLRIKFFLPKNIASNVQGGDWMYRVYLQLRRATVEGQMISTIQNLILLAGYALHIEFGEFSYREHGTADYFLLEHYLPESLITNDMADIKLRMKKSHESRRGLEKNRAVINYITLAQTFRDYGAHFYSAVWATRDGFCRDVWLSIGPRGITLYSRTNHMLDSSTSNRIVLQSLPWHHIHNFYHNKKSLYILPNAYSGVYKMGIKYKLKISDNKAYFVFWLASLHHRLYLKLYAKDDFISYLTNALNSPIRSESPKKSEVSNYQDSYNLAVRNPVRVRRPLRRRLQVDLFGNKKLQNKKPDTVELFQQILSAELSDESIVHSPTNDIGNMSNDGLSSSESSLPRRHRVKMGTRVFNGMKFSSANNHLISPQNNMFTKSEGDLTATHSDSDEINSSQKQECCVNSMKLLPERPYSQNICQSPTAYVLESPKVYSDVFKYEVNDSCMNTSIIERFDNMECIQSERIFVTAVLERDETNALGLQVAEGSDGNVYIKSVTPESPADLCKKLFPGDQIISVDGQTLLNLKYEKSLAMLQSAPKKVELIVLQNALRNTSVHDIVDSVKKSKGNFRKSATSIDADLTDDELLNEEALKTIYALIKLTKEKVVDRMKESSTFSTSISNNLQRCYSENRVYNESDLYVSSQQQTPKKGQKFNTWREPYVKHKRRPLSLSIPSDVNLPDNYLNGSGEDLFKNSSLNTVQSVLKDDVGDNSSPTYVALPRNFGLSRRWRGPVKYPVTPCKNSNTYKGTISDDVVRRHFVYGAGDSDEDQIFL